MLRVTPKDDFKEIYVAMNLKIDMLFKNQYGSALNLCIVQESRSRLSCVKEVDVDVMHDQKTRFGPRAKQSPVC